MISSHEMNRSEPYPTASPLAGLSIARRGYFLLFRRGDPLSSRPSRGICRLAIAIALGLPGSPSRSAEPLISKVTVTPAFFNPSVGQKGAISLSVARAGELGAEILDRDRFVIRKLRPLHVKPGPVVLEFDGRDDAGQIIPDEAYSIRLSFASGKAKESYDPSHAFTPATVGVETPSYSSANGVLYYKLAQPSRVHLHAGQAVKDPKTNEMDGPILKTVVDRAPRTAGAVVERWNGFDQSGTIPVSDLPNFVVSIFAQTLPENAILTVGNRTKTFVEYARASRPAKAQAPRDFPDATGSGQDHRHHMGLTTFEDLGPAVRVTPRGGKALEKSTWQVAGDLTLRVDLPADQAAHFLPMSTTLYVYCDEKLVRKIENPRKNPLEIALGPADLPPGEHRLAVNWASAFGPVGVNALRISVPEKTSAAPQREQKK